jgi:hypothetical protein
LQKNQTDLHWIFFFLNSYFMYLECNKNTNSGFLSNFLTPWFFGRCKNKLFYHLKFYFKQRKNSLIWSISNQKKSEKLWSGLSNTFDHVEKLVFAYYLFFKCIQVLVTSTICHLFIVFYIFFNFLQTMKNVKRQLTFKKIISVFFDFCFDL